MRHACIPRVPVIFLMLIACSLLSSCDTSPRHQTGCSFWQIVASPNPGNVADGLSGVFALASDNIWVTGSVASTSTSTDNRTLVEHWNGKTWSVVPSPNPSSEGEGNYPDTLGKIAGSSANDIWAVEYHLTGQGRELGEVIEAIERFGTKYLSSQHASTLEKCSPVSPGTVENGLGGT